MNKKSILLLMRGHPGSGKSTVAKKLASVFSWPIIVRDDYKNELEKAGFSPEGVRRKSYSLMWKMAKTYLSQGKSCICDSSLSKPGVLRSIRKIENETGVLVLFINCICSDENIHKKRLEGRKNMNLSRHWIKSWQDFVDYIERDKTRGKYNISYPALTVDTAKRLDLEIVYNWIILQSGKAEENISRQSNFQFAGA